MPVPPAPLAVIMLAAAMGLSGARLGWLLTTLNINVPAFTAQVRKLLMAGDPKRALKLCAVAPKAPLAAGIGAMLAAANSPGDEEQRRQRLGEIWLQGVLSLRPSLRRYEVATRVALGLAGAAVLLGMVGGAGLHPLLMMPALATGAVCAITEIKVRALETEILDAWEVVIDTLGPGLRDQMIAGYEARQGPGEGDASVN